MNIELKELLEARKKLRMTQKQVAKLVGISEHSYQNYEAERRNPSAKIARRLAEVLHLNSPYLGVWNSSHIGTADINSMPPYLGYKFLGEFHYTDDWPDEYPEETGGAISEDCYLIILDKEYMWLWVRKPGEIVEYLQSKGISTLKREQFLTLRLFSELHVTPREWYTDTYISPEGNHPDDGDTYAGEFGYEDGLWGEITRKFITAIEESKKLNLVDLWGKNDT